MTHESLLIRSRSGDALDRPACLRLARSLKIARASLESVPRRVEVEIFEDGQALSARIRAGCAALSAASTYLRAASVERQASDLTRALAEAEIGPSPAPAPSAPRSGTAKTLFFRSLLNSPDKELGAHHLYQGVFYLASALKNRGLPFVLVEGRISLEPGRFVTDLSALDAALDANPDVNLVAITLFDSYFEKARELMAHIRRRSTAFIALGGSMPSQHPFETLAHLPDANLIVRGAGEEVLPRVLEILGGANTATGLDGAQLEALSGLDGVLWAQKDAIVLAGADEVLRVKDLDASTLDFSLLEERDVASGTVLYLSRGCPYACFFCTSMDKARFSGKSAREFGRLLAAYGRRLQTIYGKWPRVPTTAFGVGFYDDDFLSDRDRAIELFRVIEKSPFFVRFFQASINSFFRRDGRRWTDEIDTELLDAMPQSLFLPRIGGTAAAMEGGDFARPYVYIGTENYCDEELERLGKPYVYARVKLLVRELSRRGIRQAHHFIVSNAGTTPDQIVENLWRIASLKMIHGDCYDVLRPLIPHLTSFYASPSYRLLGTQGLLSCVRVRERLAVPGYPELDYPLVDYDVPMDPDAAELADRLAEISAREEGWVEILGATLDHLCARVVELERTEATRPRAARLGRLADLYRERLEELAAASGSARV